jgi:hypothetical protein
VKNCDNLFHWVPFGTLNQQADQTNLFTRDNLDTKAYACDRGEHCLEKSPLFSLFGMCFPQTNSFCSRKLIIRLASPSISLLAIGQNALFSLHLGH